MTQKVLTTRCPHCGYYLGLNFYTSIPVNEDEHFAFFICPQCYKVVCATFAKPPEEYEGDLRYIVKDIYPNPQGPFAPTYTPSHIADLYVQALNYHKDQDFKKAALKALETIEEALREEKNSVAPFEELIENMKSKGSEGKELAEWINEVTSTIQKKEKEQEKISPELSYSAINMTETLLIFLFSLPNMIKEGLNQTEL